MNCRNCNERIHEQYPGIWWHTDSQHAWCGFSYRPAYSTGRSQARSTMPYPIPDDQRATPTPEAP